MGLNASRRPLGGSCTRPPHATRRTKGGWKHCRPCSRAIWRGEVRGVPSMALGSDLLRHVVLPVGECLQNIG